MKLTKNERKVLRVLRGARYKAVHRNFASSRWLTPTQIGRFWNLKRTSKQACSWACRHLRKLQECGYVSWAPSGVYAITKAGLAALEAK